MGQYAIPYVLGRLQTTPALLVWETPYIQLCHIASHRRSQDFVCGGALYSWPKSDDLFSSHLLLHGHILPATTFLSVCGGALAKFSPIFAWFQQKMPIKFFFVALGCTCTSCTPWLRLCSQYRSQCIARLYEKLCSGTVMDWREIMDGDD